MRLTFRNASSKVIKYALFIFTFFNRVDDAVGQEIVRFTGPLKPNETSKGTFWENIIYNNTVSALSIDGVAIQYMDGTEEALRHDDIDFSKPWF